MRHPDKKTLLDSETGSSVMIFYSGFAGGTLKNSSLLSFLIFACTAFLSADQSMAWHDATHMAVVKAAGLDDYAYLAVGADMAKEKAGDIERGNHYCNTPRGVKITPKMVLSQVRDYNRPGDSDGHLYGAIIAALQDFMARRDSGKYAMYPFGYAAHYIGDLSMPFHNIPVDEFTRKNHAANDGIIEMNVSRNESTDAKVARLAAEIRKRMAKLPSISFSSDATTFQREVAAEIAAMANKASVLAYSIKEATHGRSCMTEEEAYSQLAQSARLLKGVAEAIVK